MELRVNKERVMSTSEGMTMVIIIKCGWKKTYSFFSTMII